MRSVDRPKVPRSVVTGAVVLLAGAILPRAPVHHDAHPPDTGGIRGRVLFDGAATPEGVVASDAIVYLLGETLVGVDPPEVLPAPVMDQYDYTFVPHVLPVLAGTRITFTNNDPETHNIHTYTKGPRRRNRTFNQAQRPGSTLSTVFANPDSLRVLCDIHSQMLAHIMVLPNPFFVTAHADGTFQLTGVPAGRHELRAWHEAYGPATATVEVVAGAETAIDLDLAPLAAPNPGASSAP